MVLILQFYSLMILELQRRCASVSSLSRASAWACTCADGSQRSTSGILLHCSPPYFLGTRSLSESGVTRLTELAGQQTPGICLTPPPQRFQTFIVAPGFCLCPGNLNSAPSACTASTLSTEPSTQVCFFSSKMWVEPTSLELLQGLYYYIIL